jgi:hypothetical protein
VIGSGGPNRTLGGQCNEQNCSAVWSTAGLVLDSQPSCLEGERSGAAAVPNPSRE